MAAQQPTADQVMAALRNCYDPEIPINIVDLGLIYDVKVKEGNVHVKMTLTARGCPAHTYLQEQVREEVLKVPGVKNAEVEIVWDPPWTPDRMSDFAKRQMGVGAPPTPQVDPNATRPMKRGKLSGQPDGSQVLINERSMAFKVSPEVITFWELCDGTRTVNQIVDELAAKINANADEIRPQVVELTVKLIESELLS